MGRYRNFNVLAAVIVIQVVGLAVQVKRSEDQSARLIRVWAVTAVTPLEKGIVRLQSGGAGAWHNYFYLRGVRQQNRELQQQIQQLQLEQVRLGQDAQQARRLQSLLGFKEQFISQTVAAQVIGSSGSEQSRIVYLDKGTAAGVRRDMAVITANGVVGKVLSVWDSSAQVLLLNDQSSGVGAILEQSRLQGVLKGKASGELVLDKVMSDEEVRTGDKVLTSGGDQIFPKGLVVGTVAKVSKGAEFLQISVKPAAALSHLEEVLVITKKEDHEAPVSTAGNQRAADILAQRLPSVPDAPAATIKSDTPTANAPAPDTGDVHAKSPSAATFPAKPGAETGAQAKPAIPKSAISAIPKPVITKPVYAPVSKPATNTAPAQPPSAGDAPQ